MSSSRISKVNIDYLLWTFSAFCKFYEEKNNVFEMICRLLVSNKANHTSFILQALLLHVCHRSTKLLHETVLVIFAQSC